MDADGDVSKSAQSDLDLCHGAEVGTDLDLVQHSKVEGNGVDGPLIESQIQNIAKECAAGIEGM